MSSRAPGTGTDQTALESAWGPDAARLLALLEHDRYSGVTVAALRERGIEAPAQVIYALQLAGYAIDRVPSSLNGPRASAYRLRAVPRSLNGRTLEAGPNDEP